MAITLDDLKRHLNISGTEDDQLLTDILVESTAFVEGFVGSLATMLPAPPADVYRAIKMLAAHWYENREAASFGQAPEEAPLGFWTIINNHRTWSF